MSNTSSFTHQESDDGLYQVLLLKNQMGYVSSFTPKESDGGLYQILLLKKQMRFHTKFYSSWYITHLILDE
jgi:hypothetical protein